MEINLSDYPSVLFRDGHRCYTNNGSVIFGFQVHLREIYSNSEKDFDSIHDIWYNALRDFEEGTIIHKCDLYLKKKFDSASMPSRTFLQGATKKHFQGREYNDHHSFIFFIFNESGKTINEGFKNPFKKPIKTAEYLKEYEKQKKFEVSVERCFDYINNSRYLKLDPVTEDVYKYLEFGYFNSFYEDRYTEIDVDKMKVGNKFIGLFAVNQFKQLGETVKTCSYDQKMSAGDFVYHTGFADNLGLNLPFDHIYNQIIYIRNHKQEKGKLEDQRTMLYGARKFKKEYETDSSMLGDFLETIARDEKIILSGCHFNVVFYAENEADFRSYEQMVANEFKNLDITPYSPIGANKKNLFFNSFFANIANIDKSNIIIPIDLQQSLCFFTNVTNYKNDEKGIYFNDRVYNIPVKKDVWDEDRKRIKARNFFIIAPTGEGKSVLANHIFRQFYENDIRIVIIDLGDSYRKLSLLYPDDTIYIKYQDGVGIGLNPFFVETSENISATKINELSTFVFKLWKRDRLPEEDEAVSLRKVITLYYKSVEKEHSFPQFYEFIDSKKEDIMKVLELNPKFFDIEDFLHITSEFIGKGIYSFLFEAKTDDSYKIEGKKFIVFELDEIKDNHVLLTIMLHMISEAVQKVVWKDRSTKGVIFFDEFAKMLKFPSVLSSAEYFYQAARKQEAAIGIVLQSPSQLPKNDASNAMIDNTQVMYIMQNEKGYKEIIERLSLKEHDENQLGSIKYNFTGEIKYSEFLLKIGSESNIMRLELAKKVLLAFQTEGKEYTEVMDLYKETGDMEQAIEKYSKIKNI